MKKALSFVLILVLALSLCVPVFAVTGEFGKEKGTITITNAIVEAEYSVYRVFDLESFSDSSTTDVNTGSYSYKLSQKWAGFKDFSADIDADGVEETFYDYFTIENDYIKVKAAVDSQQIGLLAMAYADANAGVTAEETKTAESTTLIFGEGTDGKGTLDLGYYLVESDIGFLVSLSTTNLNATVTEKNVKPTPVKEVQEDDAGNIGQAWGKLDTADMYQTINYRTTITVGNGSENIVLHDAMTAGLELLYKDEAKTEPVLTVKMIENGEEVLVAPDGNYTFEKDVTHDGKDPCDFELHFENTFIRSLDKGSQGATLVVYYSAQLNDQAVQFSERQDTNGNINANINKTYIGYGDDHYSTEDSTETRTYELKLYKVDGSNSTALAGASFELRRSINNGLYVAKLHHIANDENSNAVYDIHDWLEYKADGSYALTEPYSTTVTTPTTGKVIIQGLDLGRYQLVETEAPDGYNKLDNPINIVMQGNGNADSPFSVLADSKPTDTNGFVNIQNNSGTLLPSTGGVGTTMFYIVGGVLAVGAVVLLVTKKRMGSEG